MFFIKLLYILIRKNYFSFNVVMFFSILKFFVLKLYFINIYLLYNQKNILCFNILQNNFMLYKKNKNLCFVSRLN